MSTDANTSRSTANPAFERKIRLSRWAMLFERMWPRLWVLVALAALFVLVSLLGVWPWLPELLHIGGLAAFGLAALIGLGWIVRTPWPSRTDAIRRLERRSGVVHRPASAYEDTLTGATADSATVALWQAHRQRLAQLLGRLRVGSPSPRVDRRDPWALRALLLLAVVTATLLVGDSAMDRLTQAFRIWGGGIGSVPARLDAWVTPPAYTGKPPIMLVEGSRALAPVDAAAAGDTFEVPEHSVLVVRASGPGARGPVALELTDEAGAVEKIEAKKPDVPLATPPSQQVAEVKTELRRSVSVRVQGADAKVWHFKVIPDKAPTIKLVKEPERMPRGALKLTYKVEDDYGIASAEARITRARPQPQDPATSWARPKKTGPRPPLERPPVLSLRLPRMNAREAQGTSYHELAGHPWAGMRVRMVLSAKDQAGNVGRSAPIEFILPQRRFDNPLARAVVEQRRYLMEDPRNRGQVLLGLEALSFEPDALWKDRGAYLNFRTAFWRLRRDGSRQGLRAVADQLWHVALRLEDGNLSEAERALREAQEKLSKALQEGASDEEIKRLMNELRQALNQFMDQLRKQAEGQPPQPMPRGMAQSQILRQQDLERMMRDIENMARQGSRDTAQQMLSQLRDLLEQLQSGRMARQQGQQSQRMMQMMDQFGDIIGKQQRLLDDTFGEQRRADGGEENEAGRQGQDGQQGEEGQEGQQGQQGQRGQGPRGRQGRGGQRQGQGPGELGRRQGELRDRLGRLRQGLQQFGMRPPSQLGGAERSMENAERALRQGDLEGAAREEQRALEQLRQGAQSMAQQMLRQMPSQFGRAGDAPLDPLGRPQRTEGPDPGTSVKVPDEIDVQRAREILEELRRRLGEQTRPMLELDYLERLLRRF